MYVFAAVSSKKFWTDWSRDTPVSVMLITAYIPLIHKLPLSLCFRVLKPTSLESATRDFLYSTDNGEFLETSVFTSASA